MKEIQYRHFSLKTHKKNWSLNRPNVCQFELTFGCDLHCRHCYTDCYNRKDHIKKELGVREQMRILDEAYSAGIIWVCFTGGDPLTKKGFLDIYSYAKKRGFIVTVFTNGYSIDKEVANCFKKNTPFVIEITLNAVTEDLYESISQKRGSFKKVMAGIDLILKTALPLKIKTQVMKENFTELAKIKRFIKGLGLKYKPSIDLFARLNGDLAPCGLRISAQQAVSLNGRRGGYKKDDECPQAPPDRQNVSGDKLFTCAIGGRDGINIDPYGNTFLCNLIRRPTLGVLGEKSINDILSRFSSLVRDRTFNTNSKCKGCKSRNTCRWCPGKAFVETGDMEAPISYYCRLSEEFSDSVK